MKNRKMNMLILLLLLAGLTVLPALCMGGTIQARNEDFHAPGLEGFSSADGLVEQNADPVCADHGMGGPPEGLPDDPEWEVTTAATAASPLSPSGTIVDTTPTYTWSKEAGATQYRFHLMKGTTTIYKKTVPSSACGASTCKNTPTTPLGYATYKWRVQAMVNGVWKAYSAFKTFTIIKPIPTPQAPTGTITDTTPTYRWTRIPGATQYRFQLMKGTTTVYTKTVSSSACGTSTCANTPAAVLDYAAYKWRVQAMVGNLWRPYSVFKTFTVEEAIAGCDAVLLPAQSGGCSFRLVTPAVCEQIDLTNGKSYEFAWTTDGDWCETPWTLCMAGNPANIDTGENIYCEDFSADVDRYITHLGGVVYLDAAAFNSLGLTTNNGIYHWVVISFYGSNPNSRTFRVKK